MWPGTRSKRANPPAIRRRRTLPLTCCDNQRRILRQLRLAQQGRKLQGRPQGKKSGSSAAPRCLEKRPQPSLKNRGRHSNAPSRGDDDWRLSQRTWLLPVPKGRMGRPAGARWWISFCCQIEAARRGRPLFLQRLLLFVYALLYGTRFFGSAGVVRPGCGICAGSAGVTARRGWSAGTRGALVHGAVLHRAFGRAWSNIALAGRAASGLRGLREGGGCCECDDAG